MSKGKRYNGTEAKLNIKKVIAVIIALLVIIMFIAIIIRTINPQKKTNTEKKAATAYYVAYENNKWGVIDSSGKTVITLNYDEMITIPNKEKPVFIVTYNVDYTNNTYKSKVINEKGQDLFTDYEKVEAVQNYDKQNNIWYETTCLKVQKNGKYGLIDFSGKTLLNCEYDDITPITGLTQSLITTKDNKKGLVSIAGTVIIPNEYEQISALTDSYEDGYIVKNSDGKLGVIGTNKKILLPIQYNEIKNVYENNIYAVKEDSTLKLINTKTDTEVTLNYDDISEINDGYAIVKKSDKYGLITVTGEEKISPQYDSLSYIYQNYYIAKKENTYGIIDKDNSEKVEFKYNYISYVKDADILLADTTSANTDLLDSNFNVKLTGVLSEINVNKGYLKIRENSNYQYYNFKFEKKKNTEIFTTNTLFLAKKDGKFGYVDKNGVVVINYIYDDATEQNASGFVAVKKDGKWGAINSKGQTVVEPKYEMTNNVLIDFIGEWHLSEDANAGYYTK